MIILEDTLPSFSRLHTPDRPSPDRYQTLILFCLNFTPLLLFFLKYAKYFRKKMLFLGGFHDLVLRLRQRVNPFKCRPALLAEICFPHSQQEVNVLNFIIHETVYFMRIKKISTFKLNLSLCFTIIYVVMRLKSTH